MHRLDVAVFTEGQSSHLLGTLTLYLSKQRKSGEQNLHTLVKNYNMDIGKRLNLNHLESGWFCQKTEAE